MKFFNKEGKSISCDEWNALIRDRKYVRIEYNSYGKTVVDSQWVGIQTDYCKLPTMFSTRLCSDVETKWFWHDSTWSIETLGEWHLDLCKRSNVLFARRKK